MHWRLLSSNDGRSWNTAQLTFKQSLTLPPRLSTPAYTLPSYPWFIHFLMLYNQHTIKPIVKIPIFAVLTADQITRHAVRYYRAKPRGDTQKHQSQNTPARAQSVYTQVMSTDKRHAHTREEERKFSFKSRAASCSTRSMASNVADCPQKSLKLKSDKSQHISPTHCTVAKQDTQQYVCIYSELRYACLHIIRRQKLHIHARNNTKS